MKCHFCGGNIEPKKVVKEIEVKHNHILAEVSAEQCVNCHENYFSLEAVEQLQDIRKECLKKLEKGQGILELKEVGRVYEYSSAL